MTAASNLAACHRCKRASPPRAGVVTCLANGRTTQLNAETAACPLGKFTGVALTPQKPLPVPDGMLEGHVATAASATDGGCGCAGDQQRAAVTADPANPCDE